MTMPYNPLNHANREIISSHTGGKYDTFDSFRRSLRESINILHSLVLVLGMLCAMVVLVYTAHYLLRVKGLEFSSMVYVMIPVTVVIAATMVFCGEYVRKKKEISNNEKLKEFYDIKVVEVYPDIEERVKDCVDFLSRHNITYRVDYDNMTLRESYNLFLVTKELANILEVAEETRKEIGHDGS